ncbi:carbohydrate sulfotransferase 11-like [Anneissia japonica]|uniref:carbohydrate sulfotransferase 11-like n=1 Tax=Anneissia japonica TaxID=1529436 RepID=UPI0014258DD4|nr:carbohydrate sulfotransferase 11-like [Anneissia japonica]
MKGKTFFIIIILFTSLSFMWLWTTSNRNYVDLKYITPSQSSHVSVMNRYGLKVESDDDWIGHRFDLRRQHVKKLCSGDLYSKNTIDKANLIVVDEYKLMYCSVPKTGCSSWKRLFLVLHRLYNSTGDISPGQVHQTFKTLAKVTEAKAEEILQTYTKFFFLRKPLDRVLSAYRNKIERNDMAWKGIKKIIVPKIKEMYRKNKSVDAELIKDYDSVTFQEFAQYLSDNKNTFLYPFEEHWRETYRLCSPCEIDYDYIGHFDTLIEDSTFILKTLNETHDFPAAGNPTNSSQQSVLQNYYKQLNFKEIERLKERYRVDSLLLDSI